MAEAIEKVEEKVRVYPGRPKLGDTKLDKQLQERQKLIDVIKAIQKYYKEQAFLNLTSRKADHQKIVDAAWSDFQDKLNLVRDLL